MFSVMMRNLGSFVWAVLAMLVVALAGVAATVIGRATGTYTIPCMVWTLMAIEGVFDLLLWLSRSRWSTSGRRFVRAMMIYVGVVFGMILGFTGFYVSGGLNSPLSGATASSFRDALYFSLVTWTSVGYGDLQPHTTLRVVAGIEAMAGYISMAVLLGLFLRWIGDPLLLMRSGARWRTKPKPDV